MDQQKVNNPAIEEETTGAAGEIVTADAPPATDFDFADEAPEPETAADEHVPSDFEKKMAAIPENKWHLYQRIIGIVLGGGTAAALFLAGSNNMLFLSCIIVIFLGPRYFEKQCPRSINTFRKYLCIALGIGVGLGIIYYLSRYGFNFTEAPTP